MSRIVLPDGQEVDMTPPTPYEQQVLELLNVIARTLDIAVRLECGAVLRKDLKRDILETEAAIQAYRAEQTAEAEASVALDGETQAVEENTAEALTAE